MALHWPTFFTRLGSAIVFSAIMMGGLLWTEWAFFILTMLIQALCLREYFRLFEKIFPDTSFPLWLKNTVQAFSFALLFLFTYSSTAQLKPYFPALLFIPALLMLTGSLRKQIAIRPVLYSFGALMYITLPMLFFSELRAISIVIPLALVLMIWMNDTMAYLVGSLIGKTPFSEISPKKTWEGTAGGALLTILGAAVWGYYSPYYKMADWMMLALCAAVAGTAGDLLESRLKRLANVKDSGSIMPGHGGALDRFDSLLAAVPFAYCYAYVFMPPVFLVIF